MGDANQDDKDWLRDEITGLKKKSSIAILNKKRLSQYELDELFAED